MSQHCCFGVKIELVNDKIVFGKCDCHRMTKTKKDRSDSQKWMQAESDEQYSQENNNNHLNLKERIKF